MAFGGSVVSTRTSIGIAAISLGFLTGCSSDTPADTATVPASRSATRAFTPAPAAADEIFGGPLPVSMASWWKKHPEAAPTSLSGLKLLFNKQGIGPERLPGPDLRQYEQVLMVITCTSKADYLLRLQVLDGVSLATTSADSCGGPTISTYLSPPLTERAAQTELEIQVPQATKYYLTLYGKPVS
jgi:hypothetical protein